MYEDARKLEKTLLASKRDGTDWAEVDDESARYKVSLSFRNKRGACDISDSAESLCRIQHERAERERELRDKAKLASKGVPLSNPGNRLSTNGTHDIAANDEVHQTIDETGSAIENGETGNKQNKEVLDNGWKKVSRHESTRKRLANIGDDKASD
jgi:hypothetical protein